MKKGSMKLGFIGTGNMAGAIMGGIIKNEIFRPEEIIGADISPAGRDRVKETYGICVTDDNREAAEKAEVLILSVKPQYYAETIAEIRDSVSDDQLIITIDDFSIMNLYSSNLYDRIATSRIESRCFKVKNYIRIF